VYFQSNDHKYSVLAKLSLIALYILLAYDLIMVALGYFLSLSNDINSAGDRLLRDIVFGLAIVDMAAIFLIKKVMLSRAIRAHQFDAIADDVTRYKKLFRITMIIAILCLAISTYGLILVILGEKFEVVVFFVAISLVAYQFFKLRPRDFTDESEHTGE
jgi:hypothetical protein